MLQKEGKYAVATPAYFVPNILLFCFLSNMLTITRLLFTLKCITKYDMFNTWKITGVEKREEDSVQILPRIKTHIRILGSTFWSLIAHKSVGGYNTNCNKNLNIYTKNAFILTAAVVENNIKYLFNKKTTFTYIMRYLIVMKKNIRIILSIEIK